MRLGKRAALISRQGIEKKGNCNVGPIFAARQFTSKFQELYWIGIESETALILKQIVIEKIRALNILFQTFCLFSGQMFREYQIQKQTK